MGVLKAIQKNHFDMMEKRGWDKTFWAFDVHGTLIKPNYKAGDIPKEFYPYALETLKLLTDRKDVTLILYTCSHPHEIQEYLDLFNSHGIKFEYCNKNPEVPSDMNGYGYYEDKFYFNVLFEDKAGFDPEEYEEIYKYLCLKWDIKIK